MTPPSVVRIYAHTQRPDYDCPWQAEPPESSTGSGVVIGPGRVLTGAHVVADATFLQVQRLQEPDKAVAEVIAVSHDCDLALLAVDEAFTEGVTPAEVGALPALFDEVSVVGFPVGGEQVSITKGVVSRIEVQRYAHSQRYLLALTVDAAINAGNSGGPVFQGDRVVGIAFQKLEDADNIGEVVPAPLLTRFLDGVERNKHPAVPGLGVRTQQLENPAQRAHLGLAGRAGGILVLEVEHGSAAEGKVEPGDVLLRVGDDEVAQDATVLYLGKHRTRFDVCMGERHVGDAIDVTVLRSGEERTLTLTLAPLPYLVPRSRYDVRPRFFVWGGLVFQPLTRDFLRTWDRWWEKAPSELLHLYDMGARTAERREVVVLSRVLADEVNVGFENLSTEVVETVGGVAPRDLDHLVELVEAAEGALELSTSARARLVIDVDRARARGPDILARYHVPVDRHLEGRGEPAS